MRYETPMIHRLALPVGRSFAVLGLRVLSFLVVCHCHSPWLSRTQLPRQSRLFALEALGGRLRRPRSAATRPERRAPMRLPMESDMCESVPPPHTLPKMGLCQGVVIAREEDVHI